MSDKKGLTQQWHDYRPTKGVWAWSCVASIALTMVVGFTVGGWVTGGTANERVEDAVGDARAELVAMLCVDKFVTATNAGGMLSDLKEARSWEQDDFIEDGGWSTIAGLDDDVSGAADACAERLIAMDDIPAQVVDPNPESVDPVESDS